MENKISYCHLAAFVILLPFDRFYSQLVLASLLLHTIIHLNRERLHSVLSFQNLVLASIFLLNLVAIVYSSDKTQALKDFQRQLAILLFPLIFSLTGLQLNEYRTRVLKWMGLSAVFTILYLYGDAIHIILYNRLSLKILFSQVFINHNFSEPIGIHATYLSMYVALATVVFLHYFLVEKNIKNRVLYAFAIGILLAGLFQLASRSVLIAMIIIVLLVFPFFIEKGLRRSRFIIVSLLIILIAILGISRIDSFRKRYVADFKNDLTQASINNELLESRALRWHYVVRLIEHSPVIGYGSGSEKRLLKEQYFENKLYNSYLNELNAHNQYLSILLKTGAIGLLIFLFTLFYGFRTGWRSRDIILMAFLILFSIVSFSENTLDVNKGIFFYAFFFSFLIKSREINLAK